MLGNGKVFISHAHADNERTAPVVAALQAWGVDYWFDADSMAAGADLSSRIQRALEERDVFIRICTPAAQQSYWVRMETGAFRGLQAQAHRVGQDDQRVLINLIMDAGYQPEPFDLAAIFIDGTRQPLASWLEELRRALGIEPAGPSSSSSPSLSASTPMLSAGTAGPLSAAPASTAPASLPPSTLAPVASTGPNHQPYDSPTPANPVASAPTRASDGQPVGQTTAHGLRRLNRRALIPTIAILLVVIAFVALASLHGRVPAGAQGNETQAKAHATVTTTPTLGPTATPTLTFLPTSTPATAKVMSSNDAHVSLQYPLNWGTANDEGYSSASGGVTIDIPSPAQEDVVVIELFTDPPRASQSNDDVVNNANEWFMYQYGYTELSGSRGDLSIDGAPCRRAVFTSNDGQFEAWVLGCNHDGHEYMMYFRTAPTRWQSMSNGDFSSMIQSIQWI